jgi:hypothetical protein
MKSKEEIEVLAGNLANPNVCKTDNWIEGYMQGQEDMADKIKVLEKKIESMYEDLAGEDI